MKNTVFLLIGVCPIIVSTEQYLQQYLPSRMLFLHDLDIPPMKYLESASPALHSGKHLLFLY